MLFFRRWHRVKCILTFYARLEKKMACNSFHLQASVFRQMKNQEAFLQPVFPHVTSEKTVTLPIQINSTISPFSLCLYHSLYPSPLYVLAFKQTLLDVTYSFISASSRCNETVMMPISQCYQPMPE